MIGQNPKDKILATLRRMPAIGINAAGMAKAFRISDIEAAEILQALIDEGNACGSVRGQVYPTEEQAKDPEILSDPQTELGWIIGKSAISASGWDPEKKILEIVFRSSAAHYRYEEVDPSHARAFLRIVTTKHQMAGFRRYILANYKGIRFLN